jgi:hypothetical protein
MRLTDQPRIRPGKSVSIHVLTHNEADAFERQAILPDCGTHSHIGRHKASELVKCGDARYVGNRSVLVICDTKSPQVVGGKDETDSVLAFPDGGIREPDCVEMDFIQLDTRYVNLHFNNIGVDSIHGGTESLVEHGDGRTELSGVLPAELTSACFRVGPN